MTPEIRGDRVVLRRATLEDVEVLAEMSRDPTVEAWWGPIGADAWRQDLSDERDRGHFLVEVAGQPVGFAQWYEETEPMYRRAGIDLFLTASHQGQGLGRDVVASLARWLIDVRGHRRLVIDPAAANERAIACYRKVGFRPIGVARKSEHGPDGAWRDQLLMDLLADELT